jgi:hypothetical protein
MTWSVQGHLPIKENELRIEPFEHRFGNRFEQVHVLLVRHALVEWYVDCYIWRYS